MKVKVRMITYLRSIYLRFPGPPAMHTYIAADHLRPAMCQTASHILRRLHILKQGSSLSLFVPISGRHIATDIEILSRFLPKTMYAGFCKALSEILMSLTMDPRTKQRINRKEIHCP